MGAAPQLPAALQGRAGHRGDTGRKGELGSLVLAQGQTAACSHTAGTCCSVCWAPGYTREKMWSEAFLHPGPCLLVFELSHMQLVKGACCLADLTGRQRLGLFYRDGSWEDALLSIEEGQVSVWLCQKCPDLGEGLSSLETVSCIASAHQQKSVLLPPRIQVSGLSLNTSFDMKPTTDPSAVFLILGIPTLGLYSCPHPLNPSWSFQLLQPLENPYTETWVHQHPFSHL